MQSCDLINQAQHILHIIEKQISQQVANNRLILKTSIDVVRWLTFQACSLRGHNERIGPTNQGNAPQNASYTSHNVQKEILHIFSKKIRCFIRKEIGELKFSIIIDVARDESKREQMAIVLRASNMHGEWLGLQALVSNECPYIYYKNCFAHRLQLTLIAASRELQASQAAKIERLLSIDELQTSKGLNQIGTLKRARDTRWSSHLSSL
ncbi:hypothetical protein GOBAR_AA14953 [Gossypium barbadense]|uniref:DUF4371 domain-containing protein n=1 Tax=Gossypium barbadense TaxID=3634 RepID=A0A2P5XQT5_GOSBA|nr:hypothetical protein GOBAR_AA14953 [Gossypium barbadense]